jgi:uncharacterized membrane protein
MTWHYAVDGGQRGPVDDVELDRLLAAGNITPETLVWRAGMAGWQPLRDARSGPIPAAALVSRPGSESGPGSGSALGLGLTPAPVQAPQPTIDPDAAFARIAAEGRRVRIMDSLRRGWELVFAQPGESIGVSALVVLTILGSGMLPCVGSIAQVVATGPLIGGWYLYFLKRMRGLPTDWGDAWAGFSSPMLPQLVLQYVVAFVANLIVMLPMMAAFFFVIFGSIAATAADERMAPLVVVGLGGSALVALAAMIYLSLAFLFALPLIIDKQLPFWPATKLSWRVAHQQFLPLLGLLLLCGLVYLAGFLALCVGLVVALPVCVASLAFAYEDLFADAPQT